ncbi:Uncharacterised protein [Klebsiella pneumoniae subsp. ozaenae]|uniref:Uncharacterized protein n=1 Tax=Klebsiella pneumoniae subsp. ozaenae TaxID=574 RepID=A0A378C2T4_KLEPO|nr:Uncharacterised protein [Klebsiella pneumoniae subsp. ozaenae]
MDLPAPFGPMMPTIAPFGTEEAQIVNQNAVAVGFAQMADFQNFIAQTRAWRNEQFV